MGVYSALHNSFVRKAKLQVRALDRNVRYEKVQIYRYIVYGYQKKQKWSLLQPASNKATLNPMKRRV